MRQCSSSTIAKIQERVECNHYKYHLMCANIMSEVRKIIKEEGKKWREVEKAM